MAALFLTVPVPHTPASSLSLEELARTERFSGDVERLRAEELYDRLSVAADATLTELSIEAARRALAASAVVSSDLSMVIWCHHWEDEEWNHVHPFRMHQELDLPAEVEVIEIRTGNGGSALSAISLASQLAGTAEHAGPILVVGADKVNRLVMRRRFGSSIFGDAAVASLVGTAPAGLEIIGRGRSVVFSQFNSIPLFKGSVEAAWIDTVANATAAVLGRLLVENDLGLGDVAGFAPSNIGPLALGRIVTACGIERSRVFNASRAVVAQAITSDVLMNLAEAAAACRPGEWLVAMSQGLGGSVHLQLFRRTEADR